MSADAPRPGREVAYRIFAAEFDDASLSHADSDEERAPNYVISPTGARLNRVFVVGTLTEVTDVNEEMVRARVVDPTGAVVIYAGQYQPDALAFLEAAEPPAFVAVTGKARTFEPDDGDRVYTSIRPETLSTVDAETSQRWVVEAAERTLERIGTYASAATLEIDVEELEDVLRANGVAPGLAAGIPLAMTHYETTPGYLSALRETALDAARVVAGERTEARRLDRAPDSHDETDPPFASLTDGEPSLTVPDSRTPSSQERPTEESVDATAEPSPSSPDADSGAAIGTASGATSRTDDPGDFDPSASESDASEAEPSVTGVSEAEPSTTEASEAETKRTDASEADASSTDASKAAEMSADSPSDTTVGDAETDESSAGSTDDPDPATSDEELDGVDGTYEMAEEEREAVESEFGTEFSTGAEVDPPGEADIDTEHEAASTDSELGGSADEESEAAVSTGDDSDAESVEPDVEDTEVEPGTDSSDGDEADAETTDSTGDTAADDVDLQSLVVETMATLDDGEGAKRDDVVDAVIEETGTTEAAVEDAIQDALMDGECFEPAADRLTAI